MSGCQMNAHTRVAKHPGYSPSKQILPSFANFIDTMPYAAKTIEWQKCKKVANKSNSNYILNANYLLIIVIFDFALPDELLK